MMFHHNIYFFILLDIVENIDNFLLSGKLSKPVSTAVMSYQPAKSFKNRMKHSFNQLSLGNLERLGAKQRSIISRLSMPDVVKTNSYHYSNIRIKVFLPFENILFMNSPFFFWFKTDGGKSRICLQRRNQHLTSYLRYYWYRFFSGNL